MTELPQYECDQCGACCRGHLIVEADELDMLREPRLIDADPDWAARPVEDAIEALQNDTGWSILLACGQDRPCAFLNSNNQCDIYPTRPNLCVAMQAGDEQCQASREAANLPPLAPLPPKDSFGSLGGSSRRT